MEQVKTLISSGEYFKLLLDFYLIFLVVYFIIKILSSNRRILGGVKLYVGVIIIYYISQFLLLPISSEFYHYFVVSGPIILVIIYAPDLRKHLERLNSKEVKTENLKTSEKVKNAIIEACKDLSSKNYGAIITIERTISLDLYAEKAVLMNSEITKELLIGIFTPNNNPLHDGAVIIRGNNLRCAAAYYEISENENLDKNMGSRHRAGLGISEVSDSLTIIVSEETGKISIATEGILLKLNNAESLREYLNYTVAERN